jgi:hypothetical protein
MAFPSRVQPPIPPRKCCTIPSTTCSPGTRVFGDHTINVVVVNELQNEKYYNNSQSGRGFATASVPTLNAATSNQTVYSYQTDWAVLSYIAGSTIPSRINTWPRLLFGQTALPAWGSTTSTAISPPSPPAGASQRGFHAECKLDRRPEVRAGWGETGNLLATSVSDYPSYTTLNVGAPMYSAAPRRGCRSWQPARQS